MRGALSYTVGWQSSSALRLRSSVEHQHERCVMYRNILVAMDGSESSKCALNEAIRVAAFTTAKLRVVFVLDASEMSAYPVGFRDVLREDGRRVLEDAQRNLAEGGVVGEVEIAETPNVREGG